MRTMNRLEEKTEITLGSKQIAGLAIGFLVTALVVFVIGFAMGKRAERRNVRLGAGKGTEDLLSKLDEYEKKSRQFIAKRALTSIRKREVTLKELESAQKDERKELADTKIRPTLKSKKIRVALARVKGKRGKGVEGKITRRASSRKTRSAARMSRKLASRKSIKGSFASRRGRANLRHKRIAPRDVAQLNP